MDQQRLKVRYGFLYGQTYHRGRLVRPSNICMFSWKFRLLSFIHAQLAEQQGTDSAVVVVENNVWKGDGQDAHQDQKEMVVKHIETQNEIWHSDKFIGLCHLSPSV